MSVPRRLNQDYHERDWPLGRFGNPLIRGFILIALKETYLFFRNLYGLIFHPFKTTAKILAKPDWSQTILVFGLPGYFWFLFLVFFVPVFWFFRENYDLRIILLFLFYSFTISLFFLGCYLFFWVVRYWQRGRLKQQ